MILFIYHHILSPHRVLAHTCAILHTYGLLKFYFRNSYSLPVEHLEYDIDTQKKCTIVPECSLGYLTESAPKCLISQNHMPLSKGLLKELREFPNTTQDTQHPDLSMYHILNELITHMTILVTCHLYPQLFLRFKRDFRLPDLYRTYSHNGFFHMANVS